MKDPFKSLKKKFRKSVKNQKVWFETDQYLYKLCDKHPSHKFNNKNLPWIYAKALFIGRAYNTGIERKGGGKDPFIKLIKFLQKNGVVDKEINAIKKANKNSDLLKIFKQVIQSHGKLVKKYAGNDGNAVRSFWSKYLHFHVPIVPMYDSNVSKNIPALFKRHNRLRNILKENKREIKQLQDKNEDKNYRKYLQKFYVLNIALFGDNVGFIKKNIKRVDWFLLTLK